MLTKTLSNRIKEINNSQCGNNSLFFDCFSIVKTYTILQTEIETIFEVVPEIVPEHKPAVEEIKQEVEQPNKIQKSTLDYIKSRKNKIRLVEDDEIPGITNQHIVSMPPEIDEHIPKMTLADVKTDTFKATVLEDLINDFQPEPEPEPEPEALPILEDNEPDFSSMDTTPEINEDNLVFEQVDDEEQYQAQIDKHYMQDFLGEDE
ncbi:hypothetical protein JK182_01175 [Acetobacter okinawensis]|uniref:hypothetical protein n=1 Tax=Acetobacter okinawensis TaxID=1076594 RepID=UPI001BAA3281|nr:hypothetical protein [Acetobacter okinawensis]MBS0987303.1 hypothetical protein [Acetobacter okinawensis]